MSKGYKIGDGVVSENEKTFVLNTLKDQKLRTDGRALYDIRSLKVNLLPGTPGKAEVQLGTTRVIAIVSAEIVEPFPDRPTEGFFLFNTEFSPMADPNFELGRQSEYAIELGRVVERGLRESRAIDTEALCIVAGEKVWSIRVDIHIVDNGGNLIDCASIAVITAMLHFKRPAITTVGSTVTVHSLEDREPVPLSIHHIPVSVTFAFFGEDDDLLVVVDPNFKEEQVMKGRMTITMNNHKEICAVQKAGGTPISVDQVIQCTRVAAVKTEEIIQVITSSLKKKNK